MLSTLNKWLWFVLLVILNWLDYHTTKIMVDATDHTSEANPLLRTSIEVLGVESILWWKCSVLLLLAVVLTHVHVRVLYALTGVFYVVVLLNLYHVYGGSL